MLLSTAKSVTEMMPVRPPESLPESLDQLQDLPHQLPATDN